MLRLVSQFDDENMRASVATPTCGPCCSCCCSCIVTTLTSSIFTSRNLGKLAEASSLNQAAPEAKLSKRKARLYGFFLLPAAIGSLFLFSGYGFFIPPLLIPFVIFGAGLYTFHNKYRLPKKTALTIFFMTIAGVVIEFYLILSLID